MDINVDLLQWFINVLEVAEELKKTIIRKFKKRKVHSSFIDNICDADRADM